MAASKRSSEDAAAPSFRVPSKPRLPSKTSAAASFWVPKASLPSKTSAVASFRVPSKTTAASFWVSKASLPSKIPTSAAAIFRVPSDPASLPPKTSAAANAENSSDAVAATNPVRVSPKHATKKLRLRAVENPVRPEPEILCFRINNKYTNDGSRFYFIDTKALLEPGGDSRNLLEYVHPYPPPYLGPPVPVFDPVYCTPDLPLSVCSKYSTVAFVGGCLYIIGGFANGLPLEDVYRLDLAMYIPQRLDLIKHPRLMSRYQHDWVKCKSMISPKSSPQCVVVEGKIYVFGRKAERVMTTPCVEVYSPKDDKWEQLYCDDWPDYATVEPILGILSDQNDNKHILLQPSYGSYYETRLYTYSIAKNTLTMQRKYQPFQPALGRQHAVVDGILYCYQDDLSHLGKDAGIVGYDLSGCYKWTPIPVFGLWPHLRFPLEHIQLVGICKDFLGVLCMMDDLRFNNNNCNREYMKGKRVLFIMTFKISRLKRNPATRRPGDPSIILNASHVSSKCYLIPRGYGPLLNCLVFQDT